jgi:hypothetical protein
VHNFAVLDGNHRDEPVVIGCAGPDDPTVYIVFEDHDTRILGSMHNIDLTGQTLQHYVEERIERRESLVFWIGHGWFPGSHRGEIQLLGARRLF